MPIYTNDPCDDGLFPVEPSLRSSIGIGPKVTKAIDVATKDWLDKHPEATTTVEDDSITNVKLKDGSVNSRTIENESITTDDIADLAVTTSKIADNAVDADKIASSAVDGLRTMSTTQLGVAKVGAGLAMNGQALELDGNGDIATAVTSWLDAHPEATTTVQDGSITTKKLAEGAVTSARTDREDGVFPAVFEALTPTWSKTGHISPNDGSISENTTFSHTDYIACDDCTHIAVWVNFNATAAGIAFYDKNNQYVSGHGFDFVGSDTADIDLLRVFEVPDNATSFRTTMRDQSNRAARYEVYKAFTSIKELTTALELDSIVPSVLYKQLDVIWHDNEGHIQSSDGAISENTTFTYCDYVECSEYAAIGLWATFRASAAGTAFYDGDRNFISSVPFDFDASETGTGTIADFHIVPVPDGAVYFRTCIRPSVASMLSIASNGNKVLYGCSELVIPDKKYFTCLKDGTGDFDNIVTAIQTACETMDNTLYVGAGTWDIIEDFGGQAAVEALISSSNRGLYLKNRIHIVCSSEALITCDYAGTNQTTITWLAAFNAGDYGFTLENAKVHSSNCRYCIHDEMDRHVPHYKNVYKNCELTHENDVSTGGAWQVIGGGLGKDGNIVIDGCIFDNPMIPSGSSAKPLVSYHNTWHQDGGRSTIELTNCYFRGKGTARFTYFGNSTKMTEVIVSGNSFAAAPQFGRETDAQTSVATDIVNVEMLAWNNEIRS